MATPHHQRKIAIVTGSRADYGLLTPLIKATEQHPHCVLQLIVTGMHLAPAFGMTINEIKQGEVTIAMEVDSHIDKDDPVGIAKSMGWTTIGFADALQRLQPDLMVVLGDRFEILAACQAAVLAHIPIAHCHGGERSEGAIDECLRHAISKLASLHFVAAAEYRQRVIQMGELPERVFKVGANGLENLRTMILLDRQSLENELQFQFAKLNFLVAFHPATCQPTKTAAQCQQLFTALDAFPDANIVMTKSNADETGKLIGELMVRYAADNKNRCKVFDSLGCHRFLSLMNEVDVMIGNSSSGIIETPALGKPTVNIGERQRGRLRASSVIDTDCETNNIIAAIQRALSSDFQANLDTLDHPYGDGHVAEKILDVLLNADIPSLKSKPFYDLAKQDHHRE